MESDLKENFSQSVWLQFWEFPNKMIWHHVNVPSVRDGKKRRRNDGDKQPLSVDVENNHPYRGSCVAVGSMICCAGGSRPEPNRLFCIEYPVDTITCIDTAKPPTSAQRMFVGKMTEPREYPLMASMEGKVYIIGGTKDNCNFGEIFNPQTGETKVMKPLPEGFPQNLACIVANPKDNRIIVFPYDICQTLFYYEPESEAGWGRLPNPTPPTIGDLWGHNCAVVGTTIYWVSQLSVKVFAYDFVAHKYFESLYLEDFASQFFSWPHLPVVLHLSDDFFYFVLSGFVTEDRLCLKTYFDKMQISKGNADEPLSISWVSSQEYRVRLRGEVMDFSDAVMVNLKTDQSIGCSAPLSNEVEEKSNVSS